MSRLAIFKGKNPPEHEILEPGDEGYTRPHPVAPGTWRPGKALTAAGDFDESKHPRDEHGRFGDKGDGDRVDTAPWVERWNRRAFANPNPRLTPSEDAAVQEYTGKSTAQELNAALRNDGALSDEQRALVQLMDSAVTKEQKTEAESVYRGMVSTHEFQAGETFTDRGFVSTAPAVWTAELFSTGAFGKESPYTGPGSPWLMEIHLEAGQNFVPGASSLDEQILPRDTQFRVESVDPPLDPENATDSRTVVLRVVR